MKVELCVQSQHNRQTDIQTGKQNMATFEQAIRRDRTYDWYLRSIYRAKKNKKKNKKTTVFIYKLALNRLNVGTVLTIYVMQENTSHQSTQEMWHHPEIWRHRELFSIHWKTGTGRMSCLYNSSVLNDQISTALYSHLIPGMSYLLPPKYNKLAPNGTKSRDFSDHI